jgi:hypothetical protein
MMRALRFMPLAVGCLSVAATAGAQGNLSGHGFGFPPGQLSTRGLATGGGVAEVDPQGATNPAAIMLWGANVLFGQYDPEFRTVDVPGEGKSSTMIARFPGIGTSFRFGERVAAGLNVSTYLDRTWATTFERDQVVGADTVPATTVYTSDGSISDFRLAIAYGVGSQLSIGVGGHVFSGEHRVTHSQAFGDTVRFAGVFERSDVSYAGLAASAGFEARLGRAWQLAGSARYGGNITSEVNDSTLTRARIPNRYGASAAYHGIAGATLSARASFEEWSALQPLGTDAVTAFDAWDFGGGAEMTGPRMGQRVMTLRAGARHRTLPFGAAGAKVNELSFSAGFGIPISVDRAALDVAIVRSARERQGGDPPSAPGATVGSVSETGYTISFGIRVRP